MNLAIIGAGMAGLAAARRVAAQRPDIAITLYEKSRGYGGRVATRRRDGFVFDHGAQNIKPSPEVEHLLTKELPTDQLRDVPLPIWSFDGNNVISAGDEEQNREHKWVYADGLNQLGKLLGVGLHTERSVRIARLERAGAGWLLHSDAGEQVGSADMVLFTPPAPQTNDLLHASDLPADLQRTLGDELGKAQYNRCISLALPYPRPLERPFYALINTDRKHPIAWLALEHTKAPERCPAGSSLILPQMAPQWSLDHWDAPVETIAPIVADLVSDLLGEDLRAPLWCDRQGWRYSQPRSGADFDTLNNAGLPHGLLFAGDYTEGKGRVHLAIESGWRAADLISKR